MKPLAHTLTEPKHAEASYFPDFSAHSISDIDFKLLKKLGVKHLMFDLDQTLRRTYARKLDNEIIALLSELDKLKTFKSINLVSNNHRNLSRFATPIGARVFQPFRHGLRVIRKPNPIFFTQVLSELGAMPYETVMIGDRLKADVLGANRMGIYTIYVNRRGALDYWFDWILMTRLRDKRRLRYAIDMHNRRNKKTASK